MSDILFQAPESLAFSEHCFLSIETMKINANEGVICPTQYFLSIFKKKNWYQTKTDFLW